MRALATSWTVIGLSAERSWEELVAQARATGVRRIALADADAAARAAEAWTGGEVLAGAEGLVRLVVESGADLVLNSLVGSAGPGADRGGTRRGHRPGAREQGVAGRRRRAGRRAGRGDRRAHRAGGLRAHGASPADRRPAAGRCRADDDHRQRRPVSRSHARRAGRRDGGAGARAPDVGDGRQDHDRLGHADEQGPGGDGGAPPVRHAVRAASTWSCTRSRSCTA